MRGCALTDVWCLILPATRAAINVENYFAYNFDIEACIRYGYVTIAECPAHYFGCRTYHLGLAVERFRRQIAEQQSKTRDGALGVPSMRPNEGRMAVVFMLLRLNRNLNYNSTWLVARVPSQWESGPSATSSRSSSGCPGRSSGKHLKA
jgi:hypothetical protein